MLKDYSTIKIGGVADYIVFPKNYLELIKILKIIKKNNKKYIILGNGSNILFSDDGFSGIIISLKYFNKIKKINDCVWVGAGVNLFALNNKLQSFGLSGMEWSYGIPATVGGMIVGNGGCFEHDIGQLVEEVVVLDDERVKRLKKEEIAFSYRHSNLSKFIVLYAKLKLKFAEKEGIKERMEYYLNKKRTSQPCDLPSLGSVFKVIHGEETIYPAKLIDNMGLKGVKIGGAEISTKHAGFIVNVGNATSQDVNDLIDLIRDKLKEQNVFPQLEIIRI